MDKENNAAPAAAAAQPQQKPFRQGNRRRKKVCAFCAAKIEHVDYKDIARLSKCISERAKILPRRINGTWRTSPASAYSCSKDGHAIWLFCPTSATDQFNKMLRQKRRGIFN